METYRPGAGIAAGALMIKYNVLGTLLSAEGYDGTTDGSVNLYISLEAVMRNMNRIRDINVRWTYHKQDLVLEMESSILNMIGFYLSYFRNLSKKVRCFVYLTGLTEGTQTMSVYNPFYRSYYHAHYNVNPDYRVIGQMMREIILPDLRVLLEFIEGCYLIETDRYDGSLVPILVQECYPADSHFILTTDYYDSLYFFREYFQVLLVRRHYSKLKVITNVASSVEAILPDKAATDLNVFYGELFYRLLIAVKGNNIRSIRGPSGFGLNRLLTVIADGLEAGSILREFSSIESIIGCFPDRYREELQLAMTCTDLGLQLSLLGDTDRERIRSMVTDSRDMRSLEALNTHRFSAYPINIASLVAN